MPECCGGSRYPSVSGSRRAPTKRSKTGIRMVLKTPVRFRRAYIPEPSPASNDRYYGNWNKTGGPFFGSAAIIHLWDTSGPVDNETSIAQVAVNTEQAVLQTRKTVEDLVKLADELTRSLARFKLATA